MARRYVRDNRGRFASVGATARGGRLRTAAGNKRATTTMQGPARAGTIAKPAGLKPGAIAARRAKREPYRVPQKEVDRVRRANKNYMRAWGQDEKGPGSKESRTFSVAKRAQDIYSGKVDPKVKTRARLTSTKDPEVLRKRIKKMRDNTKAPPKRVRAAKAPAKPSGTTRMQAPATIRRAVPKPPRPTKEDRAIEKVMNLKAARPAGFGRILSDAKFIPNKALTPRRREALGLGAFSTTSESQRYRVSRQTVGSESGVLISTRHSYKASLPKRKDGMIRRRRAS